MTKYFEYLKINFLLCWKKAIEYKASLFGGLIETAIYLLTMFIFFSVLSSNFSSIISWEYYDFILLLLLTDFLETSTGLFFWKLGVQNEIKTGSLNQYISKPIMPLFGYQFSKISTEAFAGILINLILMPLIIFFFKIELNNLLIASLIYFLIYLNLFFLALFIKSLNFISFGLSDLFHEVFEGFLSIGRSYPFQFFKNFTRVFLLGFPLFFISALLIPILRNYEIWNLKVQLIILISLTILFCLLALNNWRYGLKKYEAFG